MMIINQKGIFFKKNKDGSHKPEVRKLWGLQKFQKRKKKTHIMAYLFMDFSLKIYETRNKYEKEREIKGRWG